jgi:hypothetical protein
LSGLNAIAHRSPTTATSLRAHALGRIRRAHALYSFRTFASNLNRFLTLSEDFQSRIGANALLRFLPVARDSAGSAHGFLDNDPGESLACRQFLFDHVYSIFKQGNSLTSKSH